ncbi:hypothetical protein GCK32_005718, partial [Trichostrongylus colubriformis]
EFRDFDMTNAQETRAAFAGLIEKPVLTDELLARPPFRFILDIVSSTAAKTGYLRDRFPVDALNPAKFKEKADKTAFLDSLIEAVNDGSLPAIKSAKIVAGKEAELTNMLLIKLAEQARNFQSEHSETKKTRRPSSVEEPKEKSTKSKHRSESKGKDGKKKDSKEDKKRGESKEEKRKGESKEEKRKGDSKEEKKNEESKETKKRSKSKDSKDSKDSKEKPKEKKKKEVTENGVESSHHRSKTKDKEKDKKSDSKKSKKHEKKKVEEEIDNRDINSNVVENDLQQAIEEPIASPTEGPKYTAETQSSERTDDSGISDMVESPLQQPHLERLPSARPHTSMARPGTAAARPAPPKLKRKQIAVTEEIQPAPQNVMLITETSEKERPTSEENFLVEEEEVLPEFRPTEILESNEQRGGLVQKMIDTTTVLKETNIKDTGDIDESVIAKEKLKTKAFSNSLQTVTRTVYPLSRIFDFAQEDLELMIKELDKWLNESRKCETTLQTQDAQRIGDSHKLSTVLASLEEDVNNMRSMVNATKARITTNSRRIQEVLSNM